MKTTLLMLILVATASPGWGKSRTERSASASTTITCNDVRSYVQEVGLAQARATARARGMTAAQERRAILCLAITRNAYR
jgi:hypothetical protein